MNCIIVVIHLMLTTVFGKFVGFTIDVETCSGLGNKTQQAVVCQEYFTLLSNWSYFIQEQDPSLLLSVDAGTAWACPPATSTVNTPHQLAQDTCFNITYNNKTASVAEHVIDLCNQTVIMDYDQNATNAYLRALPYLQYANCLTSTMVKKYNNSDSNYRRNNYNYNDNDDDNQYNSNGDIVNMKDSNSNSNYKYGMKQIVVGLAITNNGENALWWQTSNEKQLEELMSTLKTMIIENGFENIFENFSIFTSDSYYNNSKANPCDENNQNCTMHNTYLWHLDEVVVYNQTYQQDWLSWAQSRRVNGIYIAPHAGNRPFIGGNLNDENMFCEFLLSADHVGIDFQFFTSIKDAREQDMPFVKNCFERLDVNYDQLSNVRFTV